MAIDKLTVTVSGTIHQYFRPTRFTSDIGNSPSRIMISLASPVCHSRAPRGAYRPCSGSSTNRPAKEELQPSCHVSPVTVPPHKRLTSFLSFCYLVLPTLTS